MSFHHHYASLWHTFRLWLAKKLRKQPIETIVRMFRPISLPVSVTHFLGSSTLFLCHHQCYSVYISSSVPIDSSSSGYAMQSQSIQTNILTSIFQSSN